jgi:hypothetical protein
VSNIMVRRPVLAVSGRFRNTPRPVYSSSGTGEGGGCCKFQIGPQPLLRLSAIAVGMQIHLFVLDRAPQPPDKDVVDPATLAVYADASSGGLENREPVLASELRALVGVEDLRHTKALQSLLQRCYTEVGGQ